MGFGCQKQVQNISKLYHSGMIETIVQFNEGEYPYDQLEDHVNLKLTTLVECDSSAKFIEQKRKYQLLKNINSPSIINLTQIYQQGLIIHLIYDYCHTSLRAFLQSTINACKDENRIKTKKQLLKVISFELIQLSEFLCNNKLVTHLNFNNFGVIEDEFIKQKISTKYYVGSAFQFTQHSKEELHKFYLLQRKKILCSAEEIIQLQKRSDHLPNFILRGNKLIFTDELSETKTKKRSSQSPTKQRMDRSSQWQSNSKGQQSKFGRSNGKPKKHKYSCNFEEQNLHYEFDNQKLNRSVEQENENYSITQTKSIKVEMEHIKPSKKNRKNSIKFKITTFEQISIDQSLDEQHQYEGNKRTATTPNEENDKGFAQSMNLGDNRKNYKKKVQEAKIKAEALLSKYNKARNKSNQ